MGIGTTGVRMRFKDKVVVVLGGNSGIGLAAARAFAAEGAKVRITGRHRETLDAAQAEINGCKSYRADIADLAVMDEVYRQIGEADGRIDVLFVNAGIGGFAPLRAITEDAWDQVHSVNLKGCVFALQKALPLMGRSGSVVVTGSIGAHGALEGNGTYAAAKAGLYMARQGNRAAAVADTRQRVARVALGLGGSRADVERKIGAGGRRDRPSRARQRLLAAPRPRRVWPVLGRGDPLPRELSRHHGLSLLASSRARSTQAPCTWLRSASPVFTLAIGPFSTSSASTTHSSDE